MECSEADATATELPRMKLVDTVVQDRLGNVGREIEQFVRRTTDLDQPLPQSERNELLLKDAAICRDAALEVFHIPEEFARIQLEPLVEVPELPISHDRPGGRCS